MLTNKRVLIIDDSMEITDAIKNELEKNSFIVYTANDAKTGMQKIESEFPDIIILDLTMQMGDEGLWICRKYKRRDSQFKNIPILMLINKNDFELNSMIEHPEWYPFDSYIKKPINIKNLIENVENLLKEKLSEKYIVLV